MSSNGLVSPTPATPILLYAPEQIAKQRVSQIIRQRACQLRIRFEAGQGRVLYVLLLRRHSSPETGVKVRDRYNTAQRKISPSYLSKFTPGGPGRRTPVRSHAATKTEPSCSRHSSTLSGHTQSPHPLLHASDLDARGQYGLGIGRIE